MELRTGTPDDPFFAVVRRRHPDVDLVVLPPEGPPAAPPGTGGPGAEPGADGPAAGSGPGDDEAVVQRVSAARARVAALAGELTDRVAPGAEPPQERLRHDSRLDAVRSRAAVSWPREDGAGVLDALDEALSERGFAVSRSTGGGVVDRLTGRSDDLDVTATWAPASTALVLAVESEPVEVGRARVRHLLDQAREDRLAHTAAAPEDPR